MKKLILCLLFALAAVACTDDKNHTVQPGGSGSGGGGGAGNGGFVASGKVQEYSGYEFHNSNVADDKLQEMFNCDDKSDLAEFKDKKYSVSFRQQFHLDYPKLDISFSGALSNKFDVPETFELIGNSTDGEMTVNVHQLIANKRDFLSGNSLSYSEKILEFDNKVLPLDFENASEKYKGLDAEYFSDIEEMDKKAREEYKKRCQILEEMSDEKPGKVTLQKGRFNGVEAVLVKMTSQYKMKCDGKEDTFGKISATMIVATDYLPATSSLILVEPGEVHPRTIDSNAGDFCKSSSEERSVLSSKLRLSSSEGIIFSVSSSISDYEIEFEKAAPIEENEQ